MFREAYAPLELSYARLYRTATRRDMPRSGLYSARHAGEAQRAVVGPAIRKLPINMSVV